VAVLKTVRKFLTLLFMFKPDRDREFTKEIVAFKERKEPTKSRRHRTFNPKALNQSLFHSNDEIKTATYHTRIWIRSRGRVANNPSNYKKRRYPAIHLYRNGDTHTGTCLFQRRFKLRVH
jgi:hypothetical protein